MADTEKRTSIAATPRRRTKKEKEILQNKTNKENLASAIVTIENINRNHYLEVNRIIKSRINESLDPLKDDSTGLANLVEETSQQHYLSTWARRTTTPSTSPEDKVYLVQCLPI